jgi:hypothetical protein
MKVLKQSFKLSILVFIVHIATFIVFGMIIDEKGNGGIRYGIAGSIYYLILVAYWAYYFFCFIYLLLTRNTNKNLFRILISQILMIVAYLVYRIGDIIDGDFLNNFELLFFLAFLLTGFLIFVIDKFVLRKKSKVPNRVDGSEP